MPKDKEDMPEDLRLLPDKDAVSVFEPYDKSPFEKERYRDVFQSNSHYDSIYVSGGRIGTTIRLAPKNIAKVSGAFFEDIIV